MSELCSGMGERLKEQRRGLKLTQKELAEYLNLSDTYISEVERGKKNLSLEKVMLFFHLFDIDLMYLLTGKRTPRGNESGILFECPDNISDEVSGIIKSVVEIYKRGSKI